jgi:hypothetical protein
MHESESALEKAVSLPDCLTGPASQLEGILYCSLQCRMSPGHHFALFPHCVYHKEGHWKQLSSYLVL